MSGIAAEFVQEGKLIARYFGTSRNVIAGTMLAPPSAGSASPIDTGVAIKHSTLRLANTDYDEAHITWGSNSIGKTSKHNSGLSTWASSNIHKSE